VTFLMLKGAIFSCTGTVEPYQPLQLTMAAGGGAFSNMILIGSSGECQIMALTRSLSKTRPMGAIRQEMSSGAWRVTVKSKISSQMVT
jgi:hypothetical protein